MMMDDKQLGIEHTKLSNILKFNMSHDANNAFKANVRLRSSLCLSNWFMSIMCLLPITVSMCSQLSDVI